MGADDPGPSEDVVLGELRDGTSLIASGLTSAGALLTSVDAFVRNQSQFDRNARLNLSTDVVAVTLDMYLDYVGSQVEPWSPAEIRILRETILPTISAVVARFPFDLPEVVQLVKTSGKEEAAAAYTRHLNVIVLPENMVVSLFAPTSGDPLHEGGSATYLTNIILHELFHLASKNNPSLRASLYGAVGYTQTNHEITLPHVPWPEPNSRTTLPDLKITNPDTPTIDVYIELEVPQSPSGGQTMRRTLAPVLVSKAAYSGGSFFPDLVWWFMAIEQRDSQWEPVLDEPGRPLMYASKPLLEQYERIIGHNLTGELFHPDEILAQNWVFVANLPSLGLLGRMSDVLSSQSG